MLLLLERRIPVEWCVVVEMDCLGVFRLSMAKPRLILLLDKDNTLLSATAEQLLRLSLEKEGLRDITIVSAVENNLGFSSRDGKMDTVLSKDNLQISGLVNPLSHGLLMYADWVICMDDESRNCRQIKKIDRKGKRIFDFPTIDSLSTLTSVCQLDYEGIYREIDKGCKEVLKELLSGSI